MVEGQRDEWKKVQRTRYFELRAKHVIYLIARTGLFYLHAGNVMKRWKKWG